MYIICIRSAGRQNAQKQALKNVDVCAKDKKILKKAKNGHFCRSKVAKNQGFRQKGPLLLKKSSFAIGQKTVYTCRRQAKTKPRCKGEPDRRASLRTSTKE